MPHEKDGPMLSPQDLAAESAEVDNLFNSLTGNESAPITQPKAEPTQESKQVETAQPAEPAQEKKRFEVKLDSPKQEKKPVTQTKTQPTQKPEVKPEQVQKKVEPKVNDPFPIPENASPKEQKDWKAFKTKYVELEGKYNDLSQRVESEYEPLKKEVEALRAKSGEINVPDKFLDEYIKLKDFHKLYQIERNPEFNSKFDEEKNKIEKEILNILIQNGLSPENAEEFKKHNVFTSKPLEWWGDQVFVDPTTGERTVDKFTEKAIEDGLYRLHKLKNDREGAIKEAQTNFKQWEQKQYDRARSEIEREDAIAREVVEQLLPMAPWAQRLEAPKGASKEQLAEIEEHNKGVVEIENVFNTAYTATDARTRTEMAAMACVGHRFLKVEPLITSEMQQLKTKIAELEEGIQARDSELTKIKNAGRTSNIGNGSPIKTKNILENYKTSDEDAVTSYLDANYSA